MNALSLCSGIGACSLGLKEAVPGYRAICYVEIDPFCQDILLARMEDGVLDRAPIWGDLKQFDGRPWRGLVDLVHAGYPCQPFSVAGKRRGLDDPRHLWPDVARVIRESEPEYVFLENVPGHLRLGFDVVARDLVEMGYRVAARLFTAAEVGAPHKRQRLYVLAALGHADVARLEGRREPVKRGADEIPAWPPGPEERDRWARVLTARPDLAPAVADDDGHRRHRPPAAATESTVRRVAHGAANRVDRLRALGNTVVPACVALAWRTLCRDLTNEV